MFRCIHAKTLWVVNFCKTKINLSLFYPGVSGQKFKLFSKIDFSDGESCFSDMLNMIEPSKFLVARDGFFVNGRSSWMLLSFKFLIACTVVLSYSLVKKICLLFQLEWCSQVLFSGVLSGEILPICDGHQIKLNRL